MICRFCGTSADFDCPNDCAWLNPPDISTPEGMQDFLGRPTQTKDMNSGSGPYILFIQQDLWGEIHHHWNFDMTTGLIFPVGDRKVMCNCRVARPVFGHNVWILSYLKQSTKAVALTRLVQDSFEVLDFEDLGRKPGVLP